MDEVTTGGPHLSQDRLQSDPHMAIPPLRVALQTNTLTSSAAERARSVDELHKAVFGQIEPLRRVCDDLRATGGSVRVQPQPEHPAVC